MFRCRPDGSKMEAFSMGYRNPYRDIAFDDKFNLFHTDNDQEDGSKFQGCRIMHVAEGADFGWRSCSALRCCRTDFVRGAVAGEMPGKLPPMVKTGRGSPAGLLIYNDTRLPEQYRGLMFYPDVFRKLVRAYKAALRRQHVQDHQRIRIHEGRRSAVPPEPDDHGAGRRDLRLRLAHELRRGGQALRRRRTRPHLPHHVGRHEGTARHCRAAGWIAGRRFRSKPMPSCSRRSPRRTSATASKPRKELTRRGAKARDLVLKKFVSGSLDGDARLVALGILTASWNSDVEDLFRLLINDDSSDVRRLAVEGLGVQREAEGQPRVRNAAEGDSPTRARRCGGSRRRHRSSGSRRLRRGARERASPRQGSRRVPEGRATFAGSKSSASPASKRWSTSRSPGEACRRDLAVSIFLALRTKPGADAIPEMLLNPDVTADQPRSRSCGRTRTTRPTRPFRSTRSRTTSRSGRTSRSTCCFAAVDTFAASGDAIALKATALVLNLLNRPDEPTRISAIIAIETARMKDAAPRLMEFIVDTNRTQVEARRGGQGDARARRQGAMHRRFRK